MTRGVWDPIPGFRFRGRENIWARAGAEGDDEGKVKVDPLSLALRTGGRVKGLVS